LKQTGHTMRMPPDFANRSSRSPSGGHPSHATPVATPSSASRTASLVRNMTVGRPCSDAPSATRKATVHPFGILQPVVRLMAALLGMAESCPLDSSVGTIIGGRDQPTSTKTEVGPILDGVSGYGQFCPVSKAAEVICQRWTPLILRECSSAAPASTRSAEACRPVRLRCSPNGSRNSRLRGHRALLRPARARLRADRGRTGAVPIDPRTR